MQVRQKKPRIESSKNGIRKAESQPRVEANSQQKLLSSNSELKTAIKNPVANIAFLNSANFFVSDVLQHDQKEKKWRLRPTQNRLTWKTKHPDS